MRKNLPENAPVKPHDKKGELESDDREHLLSLYISEYGMLTTRCTYWMTVHYGLLPLVALLITVVAQLWAAPGANHTLLIWGCVVTVHIITLLWSFVLTEYYRAVYYLEVKLRPMVEEIILGGGPFWQYERFLANTRKRTA